MMLDKYLQVETLSVVLIGDFNPVIFQPFWLSNKNLIREDEAKNAKIEIIHNELVRIDLDWVSIEVTRNRCEFRTDKEPYFDPLKDLVTGVFTALRETPLTSIGINHILDLSLQSLEKYYNFGSGLTPLQYWSDNLKDPRLMQLEIFEEVRADGQKGSRRIRISPSSDQSISFGVSINFNNHFEISASGNKNNLIQLIEKNWTTSISDSRIISESLLNKISF